MMTQLILALRQRSFCSDARVKMCKMLPFFFLLRSLLLRKLFFHSSFDTYNDHKIRGLVIASKWHYFKKQLKLYLYSFIEQKNILQNSLLPQD